MCSWENQFGESELTEFVSVFKHKSTIPFQNVELFADIVSDLVETVPDICSFPIKLGNKRPTFLKLSSTFHVKMTQYGGYYIRFLRYWTLNVKE